MNPLHACMDGHRGGEDVALFEKVGDIVYINPSTNAYCEMVSVTYHPTSSRMSTCVRYLSFLLGCGGGVAISTEGKFDEL